MAIVNVSLDTLSRQAVLTINGTIVPVECFYVERYLSDDGERLNFSYTITSDADGLKERRQFYLPSPEELAADSYGSLNEDGLVSKAVYDDQKAIASTIDFLQRNRNRDSA